MEYTADVILALGYKVGDPKQIKTSADLEEYAANNPREIICKVLKNRSVSSYVEVKDTREVVDINELNAEIKATVAKIDKLRAEIDAIVEVIES